MLVEGGSSLRLANPASMVLRHAAGSVPRLDPGNNPPWALDGEAGSEPVRSLLHSWAERWHRDGQIVMVGLGLPETLALNDAARRHLASLDTIGGPELKVGGRSFRAGERVVTVRPAGSRLAAGSIGTVVEVDPRRSVALIRWPTHEAVADRCTLDRIGHGYAVTPRLASRTTASVLVLGSAEGTGIERRRILECFHVARPAGRPLERAAGLGLG